MSTLDVKTQPTLCLFIGWSSVRSLTNFARWYPIKHKQKIRSVFTANVNKHLRW